jgi:hypothetical protein
MTASNEGSTTEAPPPAPIVPKKSKRIVMLYSVCCSWECPKCGNVEDEHHAGDWVTCSECNTSFRWEME